jgi:hypothetical protein
MTSLKILVFKKQNLPDLALQNLTKREKLLLEK